MGADLFGMAISERFGRMAIFWTSDLVLAGSICLMLVVDGAVIWVDKSSRATDRSRSHDAVRDDPEAAQRGLRHAFHPLHDPMDPAAVVPALVLYIIS